MSASDPAVRSDPTPLRSSTVVALIGGAVVLKLTLAALVPLTGDEAYFLVFARNPDWGGFYDHPPMVGWLLWTMERFGSHPLVLRLPAIATGLLLPLLAHRLLRPIDAARAVPIALLLLYTPIFLVFVFITTDVGVVLFSVLSVLAVQRGLESDRARWLVAGGALLGLAFLSKYFAVLLGAAYAVHFLRPARRDLRALAIVLTAALPFGLLNLAWNYLHCWDHVMFNVFNRNDDGASLAGPALYLATLIYLYAFPLWWAMRERHRVAAAVRRHQLQLLATVALLPLAVLGAVSLFAEIGLHWLLPFAPAAYPLYVGMSLRALHRALVLMIGFGVLHAAVLLGLVVLPVSVFAGTELHRDAAFYLAPDAFAQALPRVDVDVHATDSYSRSAVLSYYSGGRWSVFNTGSAHARQDDRLTDWRVHDGGTMMYTEASGGLPLKRLRRYFDTVEVRQVKAGGARFAVAIARGFDYDRYRERVLERIRERYYDIPALLPVGGCQFLERYFPAKSRAGALQRWFRSGHNQDRRYRAARSTPGRT